jgi:hypothetical protein
MKQIDVEGVLLSISGDGKVFDLSDWSRRDEFLTRGIIDIHPHEGYLRISESDAWRMGK